MIFSSISFLVFFTIIILVMLLTKISIFQKNKLRHTILLISSYVFYAWWDWRFCFLMLFLTIIAYFTACMADKKKSHKLFLLIGVIFPLIVLGIFKYFNFFIDSFVTAFGIKYSRTLNIILPVGISFYTFQALSYTIDVHKNKLIVEKDFIKLALYIAFFPQLVAGPIIRASDFLPQLQEERNITFSNFKIGIQIFLFGFFKKIVIADWLSVFVDDVFRVPQAYHAISLLLAIAAYSIQIYFDFSGYSDMAVGCAKCLGYDFKRNFNVPYISKNITEFWRRWHISLSSWLKDYLYIPLGGNRKGIIRTYINNMITMLLGGLWHGANWTFVAWGFLHGVALSLHKAYLHFFPTPLLSENIYTGKNKTKYIFQNIKKLFVSIFKIIFTNVLVCFCWIFFRSDSFSTASIIITRIITWQNGIVQIYSWAIISIIFLLVAKIIIIAKIRVTKEVEINGFYPLLNLSKFWHLIIFFVVIVIIIGIAFTGENPFVYFQF